MQIPDIRYPDTQIPDTQSDLIHVVPKNQLFGVSRRCHLHVWIFFLPCNSTVKGEIAHCPLNASVLAQAKLQVPQRTTKTCISTGASLYRPKSFSCGMQQAPNLQQFLQDFAASMRSAPIEPNLPGLRILNTRAKRQEMLTDEVPAHGGSAPALEDGPADTARPAESCSRKDIESATRDLLGLSMKKSHIKKRPAAAIKKSHIKKRPAAATPPAAGSLPFPGTKSGPIYHKNVKIYTSQSSCNYRVQVDGDKVDKAFSFKVRKPKEVWADVAKYVKTCV